MQGHCLSWAGTKSKFARKQTQFCSGEIRSGHSANCNTRIFQSAKSLWTDDFFCDTLAELDPELVGFALPAGQAADPWPLPSLLSGGLENLTKWKWHLSMVAGLLALEVCKSCANLLSCGMRNPEQA